MDNELGARIRALRKECGLSQEALAQALEVSRQAVTKWLVAAEHGEPLRALGLFWCSARRVDRHAGGCRSPAQRSKHIEKAAPHPRKSPEDWRMGAAGRQRAGAAHMCRTVFYCRTAYSRGCFDRRRR